MTGTAAFLHVPDKIFIPALSPGAGKAGLRPLQSFFPLNRPFCRNIPNFARLEWPLRMIDPFSVFLTNAKLKEVINEN